MNFIESNNICKFYVVDGEVFDANKPGVWLDEFYAKENDIHVGDEILVKYESMELHEKVLGLINVPDHLYDTRDESELYPDRKEFGFAYLSANEITRDYVIDLVKNSEEMAGLDESIISNIITEDNYKDYLVFNYVMVDVDDVDKVNEVKDEIEDKIESMLEYFLDYSCSLLCFQ